MSTLFRARIGEGYAIKVLSDLFSANIKIGCFKVTSKGIFCRDMDSHGKICFDLELDGESFTEFSVNLPEGEDQIIMGINFLDFKKLLKPIKKKDNIEFVYSTKTPNKLCVKTYCNTKEGGTKVITSYVTIQDMQDIYFDVPAGYKNFVSISAPDYQKMCRDMESISSTIQIRATANTIHFITDMPGVLDRDFDFRSPVAEPGEGDDEDDALYSQHFESERLNKLGRISGLGAVANSHTIRVYTKPDLPLMLSSRVGTVGKLNVYIKSKEQFETETEAKGSI